MAKKGQAPVMTATAIKAKTGKDWDYWFAALDKAGAAKRDHKAIVKLLERGTLVGTDDRRFLRARARHPRRQPKAQRRILGERFAQHECEPCKVVCSGNV